MLVHSNPSFSPFESIKVFLNLTGVDTIRFPFPDRLSVVNIYSKSVQTTDLSCLFDKFPGSKIGLLQLR